MSEPMTVVCEACRSADVACLYSVDRIPVFLNKLFARKDDAVNSPVASVNLIGCRTCGFVFNAAFQDALMTYNDDYIQSQGHSAHFHEYTKSVLDLLMHDINVATDTVLEIGCGKEAYLFNMLLQRGVNVLGLDPVYGGNNPRIVKEYFNKDLVKHKDVAKHFQANVVVMRHVLELLDNPLNVLLALQQCLSPDATIFIESPRFEWILDRNAFWDVSHEIRNYFTEDYFQGLFSGKALIRRTFADQYMVVKARLSDLKASGEQHRKPFTFFQTFSETISHYRTLLQTHKNNLVWGGAAKGSAFCNILDPEAKLVQNVVDINVEKQGRFVPLTGHRCVSPADVPWALGDHPKPANDGRLKTGQRES